MRKNRGFSLIELIIVIVIISILSSIAIINFGKIRASLTLDGAARQIFSDMLLCKAKALEMGGDCSVVFNVSVASVVYDYIIIRDNNKDCIYEPGDIILAKRKLSDEYENVIIYDYPSCLRFNRLGFSNINYTIIIKDTNYNMQKNIKVSKLGKITIDSN